MLINFRVENFRSFREEVEFTALATAERQHRERLFHREAEKLSLLPLAAFYGGNGAGKSNLYLALRFARHLLVRGGVKPEDRIAREPFRLDPACRTAPSRFGFDLLIGDQQVRYRFAVTGDAVQEESLELRRTSGSHRSVYRRVRESNGNYTWSTDAFRLLQPDEETREFLRYKRRDVLPNELFLGAIRGRKIPLLEEVGAWFHDRLVLLDPHSEFRPVEFDLSEVASFRDYCLQSLARADTGIDGIENEPIPLEALRMPTEVKEDILRKLEAAGDKRALVMRGPDRVRYMFARANGVTKAFKLTTSRHDREGNTIGFDIADESEGTERLIELLPAFYELTFPGIEKTFFIDELDRSLHTHLTRKLIESFLDHRAAGSRTQLLFTTHDPLLLDQDLLRRDEVWFLTKRPDGHSDLAALSDFKGVRSDRDIRKSYLLGRFSGVPELHPLPAPVNEPAIAE